VGVVSRHTHGDYAVLFWDEVLSDKRDEWGIGEGEFGFALVRVSTGEVLGHDGGAPEDQLLVRDWAWVPRLLASEVAEATKRLQRELADLARESVARELKLARLEGEVERMRRSWWWAGG